MCSASSCGASCADSCTASSAATQSVVRDSCLHFLLICFFLHRFSRFLKSFIFVYFLIRSCFFLSHFTFSAVQRLLDFQDVQDIVESKLNVIDICTVWHLHQSYRIEVAKHCASYFLNVTCTSWQTTFQRGFRT